MRKEEKGSLIVEATFVFPVMFFILLFLIYMGNMFYMRSQVDAIVSNAAVSAAAKCADSFLATVEEEGSVPYSISDIKPYHTLFNDSSDALKVRNDMVEDLNTLGAGFFAGMGLRDIKVNQFEYESHLFYGTFTVDVSYCIRFPIRFLGENQPTILKISSHCVAPVTDTGEFIQNVDMVIDYADSTGVSEKINKLVSTVSEFLGN